MNYQENMSGWHKSLQDNKLAASHVHEDRVDSIKRLVSSGLPTYKYHFLDLPEIFTTKLDHLYEQYGKLVVRACPKNEGQRITLIDKKPKEIRRSLENLVGDYDVIVNIYDPAQYVAVIISDQHSAKIELARDVNHERLCHGHITPYSASFSAQYHEFPTMSYHNIVDKDIREQMWQLIKTISTCHYNQSIPHYTPKKGYFEFAISDQIRCIDYKPL